MDKLKPFNQNKKNELLQFKQYLQSVFLSLIVIIFFYGCAASLSPAFNQSIVDNLSTSSKDAFQLVAGVSSGTSMDDFNKRESDYNKVIGELDALQLQIKARPVPKSNLAKKIMSKVNGSLIKRGITQINASDSIPPSAVALKDIEDNIINMRDTDKQHGLRAGSVVTYKGVITLYFDQAITYESFLNKK